MLLLITSSILSCNAMLACLCRAPDRIASPGSTRTEFIVDPALLPRTSCFERVPNSPDTMIPDLLFASPSQSNNTDPRSTFTFPSATISELLFAPYLRCHQNFTLPVSATRFAGFITDSTPTTFHPELRYRPRAIPDDLRALDKLLRA